MIHIWMLFLHHVQDRGIGWSIGPNVASEFKHMRKFSDKCTRRDLRFTSNLCIEAQNHVTVSSIPLSDIYSRSVSSCEAKMVFKFRALLLY